MNEKDLKKLNRLELLQLLLEESKENERLREENEQIKQRYSFQSQESRALDALSNRIKSLENSVSDVKQIASQCATTLSEQRFTPVATECADIKSQTVVVERISESDAQLLEIILDFYKTHSYLLGIFPKDIQSRITERIKGA